MIMRGVLAQFYCYNMYVHLTMYVLFTLTGVTVNPASMKQALTASAIRLDEANMFEQGMSMGCFYRHIITLLISLCYFISEEIL